MATGFIRGHQHNADGLYHHHRGHENYPEKKEDKKENPRDTDYTDNQNPYR